MIYPFPERCISCRAAGKEASGKNEILVQESARSRSSGQRTVQVWTVTNACTDALDALDASGSKG